MMLCIPIIGGITISTDKRLYILGAGGHAKDIADIARSCGWKIAAFFDDNPDRGSGYRIDQAGLDRFESYSSYVVGANWPWVKRQIVDKYIGGWLVAPAIIHSSATLGDDNLFMSGVVIGANTSVGNTVTLSPHVHIGAGVTITRATVGRYTTIGPGANVCGDVSIGREVVIGAGATVSNLIEIGDNAIIGAGAVVVKDVPNGMTVAGVPARKL